jgi:DNA-binding MarR family transcriptional regulator
MTFQAEDFPGYWLFRTQRSVVNAFDEALKECCQERGKPYVVTPPQFGVLALLDEQEGMTIGSISQKRGVDAPTITGIVTRLEQSGLVERRHDRKDRRQVYVFLTGEGADIMRYLPDVATALSETMLQGFSQAERQDLIAKLQQIITNLSDGAPDAEGRSGCFPGFLANEQAREGENV